jgi:hypothetical protein
MLEYKHGRIYVRREDAERLVEQVWIFDRDPQAARTDPATPLRLRFYATRTRPSRRHRYRGKPGRSWGAMTEPRDRHLDMPREEVPLPDDVLANAVFAARDLVTVQLGDSGAGRGGA